MADTKADRGKVEIFLAGEELAFFDELRDDMSRAALARILIRYALSDPEAALGYHGRLVVESRKKLDNIDDPR